MNKFEYNLRFNKYQKIKNKIIEIVNNEEKNIDEIIPILENIILLNYGNLKEYVVNLYDFYDKQNLFSQKFKDLKPNERKIRGLLKKINELSSYRFCLMGGATGESITLLSDSDENVWDEINSIIKNCWSGHVRCAYCIEKNGEDVGTLYNMNALFTPKISDKINSIKADDILPDWKNYK